MSPEIQTSHQCPYCGNEIPNGIWNWCEHNEICDHSIKKPKPYKATGIILFAGRKMIEHFEQACKNFIKSTK